MHAQHVGECGFAQPFPHAIGEENEGVAFLHFTFGKIEMQLVVEANAAREHMAHAGAVPDVIDGQLRELAAARKIAAAVTHVREAIALATQHQGGERGGHAAPLGVRARLRHHPTVDRVDEQQMP